MAQTKDNSNQYFLYCHPIYLQKFCFLPFFVRNNSFSEIKPLLLVRRRFSFAS